MWNPFKYTYKTYKLIQALEAHYAEFPEDRPTEEEVRQANEIINGKQGK